jgi:hypothetical protein
MLTFLQFVAVVLNCDDECLPALAHAVASFGCG